MDVGRMRFTEKVCLVTGGGSGIGRAVCERFAAEGGRVVVVDRAAEPADEGRRVIERAGGAAIAVTADVSVSADVQRAVRAALERWGRLDVVVNNAATMTFERVVDLPDDQWDVVLGVNLRSAFLCCKYALPHLRGGAIVNVGSVHAHETTAGVVPYATSKGGMEAFTRGLSRECDPAQARVNCVAPGPVDTPMLWQNPRVESGEEQVEGEVGRSADLAAVVAFLASDEARFVHGATLVADGGRLAIL